MKAPCRYFGKCSGCSRQQFPYEKQLRDKGLAVAKVLGELPGRAGLAEATVTAVVPSPMPFGYRTTTKLCLAEDNFGRRSIGLYERASKRVVDIPGCPVHHKLVEDLVTRLVRGRTPPPAPFYNHGKRAFQPGCLKFLTIRVCPVTGEAGVVISHTGISTEKLLELAKRVASLPVSIWHAELTATDGDYVIGRRTAHLAGPERARFAIGGRIHALSPLVFFQANGSLTDAFVQEIIGGEGSDKPASSRGEGVLLDLYGGFGAYAAGTADCRKAYVVDGNPQAIKDATANMQTFGLNHIKASAATVEAFLDRGLPPGEPTKVTRAIVNPPRGGLSPKVTTQLGDGRFPHLEEIVYVSCNAETMTRDIAKLTREGGFRLTRVVPFDMFPQTEHVECVARLTRQAAPRTIPRRATPSRTRR